MSRTLYFFLRDMNSKHNLATLGSRQVLGREWNFALNINNFTSHAENVRKLIYTIQEFTKIK
jgi:hypothetical protein